LQLTGNGEFIRRRRNLARKTGGGVLVSHKGTRGTKYSNALLEHSIWLTPNRSFPLIVLAF
ncbi:hypothetical protein RZS08_00355, partial [Arthrospira platensis SPKY1]|nr:hypothetical protein [Arthrospira platensis SPKY1]